MRFLKFNLLCLNSIKTAPTMKNLLFTLILLASLTVNSQSKASSNSLLTKTEWINKDLDYLRFNESSVIYNFDNKKQEVFFDLENKKLSFKVNYRVGGDFKTEEFEFKIKELKKNKLVIVPIIEDEKSENSKLDRSLFSKEKQYVFYNRGSLLSKVNFKKITFHSSTCFGTCPSMSVQINIDGTVYYKGKEYADKKGNFVGKLSKNDIYQLKKILNRSQLRNIDENWKQKSKHNDTPKYTYIVELFDGETIEINTNDQHPILDKLSNYLLNIKEKVALEKVEERHKFDKSKIGLYKHYQ